MTCRQCGTEIAEKAIVCYRCGTPTAEPVAPGKAPARGAGGGVPPWVLRVLLLGGVLGAIWWLAHRLALLGSIR
jgi:hypothetical protein